MSVRLFRPEDVRLFGIPSPEGHCQAEKGPEDRLPPHPHRHSLWLLQYSQVRAISQKKEIFS